MAAQWFIARATDAASSTSSRGSSSAGCACRSRSPSATSTWMSMGMDCRRWWRKPPCGVAAGVDPVVDRRPFVAHLTFSFLFSSFAGRRLAEMSSTQRFASRESAERPIDLMGGATYDVAFQYIVIAIIRRRAQALRASFGRARLIRRRWAPWRELERWYRAFTGHL